jgi:2-polyprenyl-3-methyl-5-hydroxy-6-metoxy-1,4-benzoquinol methylase
MVDIPSVSDGLRQADDGIWYSAEDEKISYPAGGNETCFRLEDGSFWFRHRNECIETVVSAFPPREGGAIFDVGGGNGFVSLGLAKSGFDVVLVEPGQEGATNSAFRGLSNVVCATTDAARFHPESLPAVGLFDVVEHIEDDKQFLVSTKNLIEKGGRLYVTVPAYSMLWSHEDVLAGHYRRYSLKEISKVIHSAGFKVEFASYIFRFLPLPAFLLRAVPYRLGISAKDDAARKTSKAHLVRHGKLASFLEYLLQGEIECLRNKRPIGFGGSCLIVATRS